MSVRRLLRNGLRFWRTHGTATLLRELQRRLTTPVPPGMSDALVAPPPALPSPGRGATLQDTQPLVAARFHMLAPLVVFAVPAEATPRVTLVTDSLNRNVFFGGVATSVILALLLARRRGARLRIATRVEPPQGTHLHLLLERLGLEAPGEIEFAFAPGAVAQASLNVQPDELFLTASWWTTHAVLAVVPAARVLYLLQEDERAFYPAGEDQLRAQQVMNRPGLHLAVNSRALLQHLADGGVRQLDARAVPFEPAFPPALYHPRPRPPGSKRRLMFYARPQHLRNLFYTGLELIDRAVVEGVLDPSRWELHFVGSQVPTIRLSDGTVPECHDQLSWQHWAELLGTMDLGLSLMASPHPSYPPLDLAASGAVVLSNRWGLKTDLSGWSGNILLADAEPDAMLAALCEAITLAEDDAERMRRHAANRLPTDWPTTLAPVIERYGQRRDAWA